jgi:hypothetical protein
MKQRVKIFDHAGVRVSLPVSCKRQVQASVRTF